jgi:hypothetical protein
MCDLINMEHRYFPGEYTYVNRMILLISGKIDLH